MQTADTLIAIPPNDLDQIFEPLLNEVRTLNQVVSAGPVAQWIRHRPTEPGIAGSSPAGVIVLMYFK